MKHLIQTCLATLATTALFGQNPADSTANERWNIHFQATTVVQHKPKMAAKYTFEDYNSLSEEAETATSLTATIYVGARLWKGAEIYLNPELAGGAGISRATGAAGFPNGETFRVGNPSPTVYLARLYLKQTVDFDPQKWENTEGGFNELRGRAPKHGLTFYLGKISLADFFDNNEFSHDPRTRFLNWSLMSNGAWDYPADVRGYTIGAMAEYRHYDWSIRLASTLEPTEANGAVLNEDWSKANGTTLEIEKNYKIGRLEGTIRALGFFNTANMGNYAAAVEYSRFPAQKIPDLERTRQYGRSKYGFGLNVEQNLTRNIGIFSRYSWNDGQNETWAFTEIDNSFSVGGILRGAMWQRADDMFGAAFVSNGISVNHQNLLRLGGKGFIIGDGNLNYGREAIFEVFYSLKIKQNFWFSPDFQWIINPAYNLDRGSAMTFTLRAHIEI